MADTNWHIVEAGDRDTRVMLDPHDLSAPYFNVHYMDMAGDNSYVEFVHDSGGSEAERVEIDRIYIGGVGPVGDHEKAIRQEIRKRGLPKLDIELWRLFGPSPSLAAPLITDNGGSKRYKLFKIFMYVALTWFIGLFAWIIFM